MVGAETEKEEKDQGTKTDEFSERLLELARKMRMNTDSRRRIFCLLMSSEDYLDCSEKLVKLGTKNQMEREVVFVITDCCIQEAKFNPYYGHVASKLASLDRKYRLAMTFCIWDRIKQVTHGYMFQFFFIIFPKFQVKNDEELPMAESCPSLPVSDTREGAVPQSA